MALNNNIEEKSDYQELPGIPANEKVPSVQINEFVNYQKLQGVNQGDFNPANIVIEGSGTFNNYNHEGATLALNAGASVATSGDNVKRVQITFSQDCTVTLTGNWNSNQIYGLPTGGVFTAGTYMLAFYHDPANSSLGFILPGGAGSAPIPNPPIITSSAVLNINPSQLVINYDRATNGTEAGFTFRVDSVDRTITYASGDGTGILIYTISGAPITTGQVLDLAYAVPPGDTVASDAPNTPMAEFLTPIIVNNNIGAIQLTALTLGTPVVGDEQITIPISANPNGGNEDLNQLYHKLSTEPTTWESGVTAVTGATTFPAQTGLTNSLEYDFKAVAEGSGAYSDSPDSNEVSATPSGSIIVMQDDFTGTTIDTVTNWDLANSNTPQVDISQNNQLNGVALGTASTDATDILKGKSFKTINRGALKFDYAMTPDSGYSTFDFGLHQDSDNFIVVRRNISGSLFFGMANGVSLGVTPITINFTPIKIVIEEGATYNIVLYEHNGSSWDTINTKLGINYNIPDMRPYLSIISSHLEGSTGTVNIDNLYLTNEDFPTLNP